MCNRRKNNRKEGNEETQIPIEKKKLSCKRRCKRWFFRKLRRCFNKAVCGKSDPHLSDFNILGINLGWLRDKIRETANSLKRNVSHEALAENKIKLSKVKNKDIEEVKEIKVTELKKNYSVTGSQLKVLVDLVQDFKRGNISASKLPRLRMPFRNNQITKPRLREIIQTYDEARKEKDAESIKSKPKKQLWDYLEDLNSSKLDVNFFRGLLINLKHFINEDMNLTQLSDAVEQGRGISLIIRKSKLSFISKLKLQELLENLKDMRV